MPAHRSVCVVPFCGRCRGPRAAPIDLAYEWICREHWPRIPLPMRKAWKRALRRRNDAASFGKPSTDGMIAFGERGQWTEHRRAVSAELRLWNRLTRFAIERALGISA